MTGTAHLGDPATASQLGSALRRGAAALVDVVLDNPDTRDLGPSAAHVTALADLLDQVGARLQTYAVENAAVRQEYHALAERVDGSGLELRGWLIAEPWGVTTAEQASARLACVAKLQRAADRLHTRHTRLQMDLTRTANHATHAAARTAAAARALALGP